METNAQVAPTSVVVMGVSGSGKSTVAAGLVKRLGWDFAEGDDFHPAANVEKMRSGQPLDDDDRWPWLRTLAAWIGEHEQAGTSVVVTCSALKRSYRDLLRTGNEGVWFAYVDVPEDVLAERLGRRQGHYMPPSLLTSQLATLEPLQDDEAGITVPGTGDAEEVVDAVLAALSRTGRA
jgi:gluconokinase